MKKILLLTSFLLSVVLIMGQTTGINKSKQAGFPKFGRMAKAQQSEKTWKGQRVFNKNKKDRQQEFALKSAEAVKQRLDSYTFQEDGEKGKFEFVYDVNGMLTQEREFYWDETTAKMVLVSIAETTYDTSKNKIQYVNTYLDETTNQFVIEYKVTYSYDKNGNLTQSISNYWDTTNNQARKDKTDYLYDSGKNLIQEISSYFDEPTNQFVLRNKTDYKYNGSGKETQQISYYWDSYSTKQWEPQSKTEFTYDSQGNLIISLESYANNINNTWIWTSDSKDENTYDTKGQLIQSLNYRMDYNGVWVVHAKDVYVFDENGNNTQGFYYYNWDVPTNQWKEIYKDEYTYNNNYTKNDLILPFEDDEAIFTHMITDVKGFSRDSTTNEWILDYQISLVYSPQNVTSATQLNAALISVYPNPCSESILISFSGNYSKVSFELFDSQGRKIISKQISNNEKLSMQGLNSGLYLYNLNFDGKMERGKLIKEN